MRDVDAALGIQVADGIAAASASQLPATPPGFGHASLGFRASYAPLSVPRFDKVAVRSDSIAIASVFPADGTTATFLTADLAIGIWRGRRVKTTRVGGIDLFGSVTLIRDARAGGVLLSSQGTPAFGLGARVTLLQETADLPGISLTLAHRQSPGMTLTAVAPGVVSGDSTTVTMRRFDALASGLQLAASKRFNRFSLRAGIGTDRYEISSLNGARPSDPALFGGGELYRVSLWRANAFLGGSINLQFATLVGELGEHFGGDPGTTLNTFASGSPAASRAYLTLGLRIGN